MLLTNRLFERESAHKEAKSIYIFCEGAKREYDYFKYFKEMDPRINIEIYKLHSHENNSPLGLLKIAQDCILLTENNPTPKYDFQKNDEVWIVLDVDIDKMNSRQPQIEAVKFFCHKTENWEIVQSNPCFEVWLHYHQFAKRQEFEGDDICKNWKRFVNEAIKGGFHSSRHPIFIQNATKNAKTNFKAEQDEPLKGCTEIFKLGESMLAILKDKIEKVLTEM